MTIATIEPAQTVVVAGSSGANLIREAAAVMVDAHTLAKAIASTQMVPKHFQGKPDECAAAMLYGASLGFDPMQSIRQIYVVHGQASLYARAMDALVKGNGHETWTVSTSDESVTVAGRRKGSEHVEQSTWNIARANKAGYTRSNDKYKSDPQAMLYSKALSEVCRKIAPDVLNGVYSVEELQMEPWDGATATPREIQRTAEERMGAILQVEQGPAEPDLHLNDPDDDNPPLLDPQSSLAKRMFATFRERGIDEKPARLEFIAGVIGRTIASSSEMTEAEASRTIDALSDATPEPGGEDDPWANNDPADPSDES